MVYLSLFFGTEKTMGENSEIFPLFSTTHEMNQFTVHNVDILLSKNSNFGMKLTRGRGIYL